MGEEEEKSRAGWRRKRGEDLGGREEDTLEEEKKREPWIEGVMRREGEGKGRNKGGEKDRTQVWIYGCSKKHQE